jgi:hypothetical protein
MRILWGSRLIIHFECHGHVKRNGNLQMPLTTLYLLPCNDGNLKYEKLTINKKTRKRLINQPFRPHTHIFQKKIVFHGVQNDIVAFFFLSFSFYQVSCSHYRVS